MSEDWRAEYEARRAREQPLALDDLRRCCWLLGRLGVSTVRLAYDGADFAGSVRCTAFEPAPAAGVPEGVAEVLQEAAHWLVPAGWEVGAGSYGTLTLSVPTRTVRRDHRRRVIRCRRVRDELSL